MPRRSCCSSCSVCLRCFYSCSCERVKREIQSTCGCVWVLLILCGFLFTLIWLYVTLILKNDIHNFNEEIFRLAGLWQDWSIVLIMVAAVLVSYCFVLLLISMCLVVSSQPLNLHWLHKILLCFCAVLVSLGIIGLNVKWKIEWKVVGISLQATSPFLHIGAVIGVSVLAWVLARYFWETKSKVLKCLLPLVYIILVCALFVSPLFISSPCIMKASELPPKPRIMGHRGAPMLAPENTMMSFDRMVNSGGKVFETDVMVSWDGIPFLMHDETLLRTTNVREVFPFRSSQNSSNFTFSELQKLNAGEWFLQKNPFGTDGSVTPAEREEVKLQKIPSLEDVLIACKDLNISIIFDLREPPSGHPYKESFVNVTLNTILNVSIRQDLILWLPDDEREQVIKTAPGFKQIYGRKREKNDTDTFDAVNLSYTNISVSEIRSYRQDNISVNLFVVNKPWLFSHVWCAGATSVTSNTFHLLKDLKQPIWLLDPDNYLIIWIIADVVALIHIIWAFFMQRACFRKREEEESEAVLLMKIENLVA
ncbi:glycerophosphoinositol inositolphosphodiesterase GDPD2 [Bufo gargarizans]|uniref:glycerophosphoinositol inositolphosphodiesterase GDPD2 n=1 Tax=Bufo gargarizans TaxID=30331 RepID=UPI001CF54536|nr:glycerophosphoinositol inositolphosphodiesterase GDPD2 [Bufo gargarizans]XP_044124730.1 glycerophosphoinositol inositolphosphodiesterase GDPD2 [Bufo gargarizans]XP_044124731.1 glycerophosphoinositol inositolphosphodiesterase GDPD2 [Bufo gargarizans]